MHLCLCFPGAEPISVAPSHPPLSSLTAQGHKDPMAPRWLRATDRPSFPSRWAWHTARAQARTQLVHPTEPNHPAPWDSLSHFQASQGLSWLWSLASGHLVHREGSLMEMQRKEPQKTKVCLPQSSESPCLTADICNMLVSFESQLEHIYSARGVFGHYRLNIDNRKEL